MNSPFKKTNDSFNAEFFVQPIDQQYEPKGATRYHSAKLNFFKGNEENLSLLSFLNKDALDDEADITVCTQSNPGPFFHSKRSDSARSINDFLKIPIGKSKTKISKFCNQPVHFTEKLTKGWNEKISFFKYSEYIKLQVVTDDRFKQKQSLEFERSMIKGIPENDRVHHTLLMNN